MPILTGHTFAHSSTSVVLVSEEEPPLPSDPAVDDVSSEPAADVVVVTKRKFNFKSLIKSLCLLRIQKKNRLRACTTGSAKLLLFDTHSQ
ncbi:unnamed protein product, partial [Cuscuta europaea]